MTEIAKFIESQESSLGPASYATGGFNITMNDHKVTEKVISVWCDGAYVPIIASITNNIPKILVYDLSTGVEVTATTSLIGITFYVTAIGY